MSCTLAQALLFLSFLHWQINFFFSLLASIYDLRLPNGGFKKGWILSSYYFQDFLTARIQVYLYMSKFFKDKGQAQFEVFEKFTSIYYTKLHLKLYYFVNNVHEKTSQKVKTDKLLKVCAY